MAKLRVGIVGIGKISGIYLQNLTGMFADRVSVVAVADLVGERSQEAARQYSIPRACTLDELLESPDVDLVLNLTVPQAHFDVSLRAVEAGKHVYVEKPLTATRDQAARVLEGAAARGVRVGGAPDTFLGAGIQTCRKLIDDGWIGRSIAATAFMMNHGHEHWHPAPEFYYKAGGGPMFDMGPYYLTALVNLLGPVARVAGSARKTFPTRTVLSEPLKGSRIEVEVPTHVAGLIDFESGAVATLITSFDVWSHSMPHIEIYGTEGTLRVPDPNTFGGPVLVRRGRSEDWSEVPLLFGYPENCRGLGVADMADAIAFGRPHRASGALASHVLDLMHGFHDASETGRAYSVLVGCGMPAAMVGL